MAVFHGGDGPDAYTGTSEDDTINGNGGDDTLDGGGGDDEIHGGEGNDILIGGSGVDLMYGGAGDDRYIVDEFTGQVDTNSCFNAVEAANEGNDTVESSVTYSLIRQGIENLILTGSGAINGTGNSYDNTLIGNDNANSLNGREGDDRVDGRGGADSMSGWLGDDVFVVDDVGDRVTELADHGIDTVESSVSFSLAGQGIENLTLTGPGAINGTGNSYDNTILGTTNANVLNGGTGADEMRGGGGNDRYIVDNAGDTVVEAANKGIDTVESSVSFSLGGQGIENLTLTGSGAISGRGNSYANTLIGNARNNVLNGDKGNDKLYGGLGSDTLTGGYGIDSFWFDTALGATNVDTIIDYSVASDTIRLDRDIFAAIAEGVLAAGSFRQGAAAGDANDRIIYDSATGRIWYDADGTGADAQRLFARVDPGTALTNADFVAETTLANAAESRLAWEKQGPLDLTGFDHDGILARAIEGPDRDLLVTQWLDARLADLWPDMF